MERSKAARNAAFRLNLLIGLILLFIALAPSVKAQQAQKVTISEDTARACEDAFDEVKASRPLINDLRAENDKLNNLLSLTQKLAESETRRADAEKGRAEAEAGRAAALSAALDASKAEKAAQAEISRIRTDEVKDLRAQLKKEKRGRLIERIVFIGSHVLRTVIGF